MSEPKIALFAFAEHRNDFYQKRRPLLEQYFNQARSVLAQQMKITFFEPIRSLEKVREVVASINIQH